MCIVPMASLPVATWLRFILWMEASKGFAPWKPFKVKEKRTKGTIPGHTGSRSR